MNNNTTPNDVHNHVTITVPLGGCNEHAMQQTAQALLALASFVATHKPEDYTEKSLAISSVESDREFQRYQIRVEYNDHSDTIDLFDEVAHALRRMKIDGPDMVKVELSLIRYN